MKLISILLMLLSTSTFAQWQLDPSNSTLNFMSTKNVQITELHSFKSMKGTLRDTGIDIRNTRMQNLLFNVTSFAHATLTADIPKNVLALKSGEHKKITIKASLSLNGVIQTVNLVVGVSKVSGGFVAHTVHPFVIQANDFGLAKGVDKLREIAGLQNIGLAVPVSFSVSFKK